MKKNLRKIAQRKKAREKMEQLAELLGKPNADTLELQDEYLDSVKLAIEVMKEAGY